MRLIVLIITLFVLAACAPQTEAPAKGKVKNFGISLEAKPNQDEVKILSKPQGAGKAGKKDGYLGYAQGESGSVLFTIKKEDLSDNCAGTAEWVITQVALTAYGDPGSEKGDDTTWGTPQPDWLKLAFPGMNQQTGYVLDVQDKANAQTFAIVKNDNAQEGEKLVFYRVTLTPCDDQGGTLEPLTTDPAIRNGGRDVT